MTTSRILKLELSGQVSPCLDVAMNRTRAIFNRRIGMDGWTANWLAGWMDMTKFIKHRRMVQATTDLIIGIPLGGPRISINVCVLTKGGYSFPNGNGRRGSLGPKFSVAAR